MERLKTWLRNEGYCDAVCVQVLSVARGLSLWMEQNHVTLDELKDRSLSDDTSLQPYFVDLTVNSFHVMP